MNREVICYCLHTSNFLNLGGIPELLAKQGWRVRCYNAFAQAAFPGELQKGVEYHFETPQQQLAAEQADLYLTALVGQSSHFPRGAKRVHFLVSLTSLEGVYDESMFDHFDAIVCAGRHHMEEFAALGQRRGWGGKVLLPVGYPKLDGQRCALVASGDHPREGATTVVFAPTHAYYVNQHYSVLGRYGEQLIEKVLGAGMRLIFRPHMESWRDQDRPVVEHIVARFSGVEGFELDRSANYFSSYARSDMMLTDVSGTGFTFAFTFGRPALFFAPQAEVEEGKSGIQFECRDNIGLVVRDVDHLVERLQLTKRHEQFLQVRIEELRDYLLFNPMTSERYFVEHVDALVNGRYPSDWRVV